MLVNPGRPAPPEQGLDAASCTDQDLLLVLVELVLIDPDANVEEANATKVALRVVRCLSTYFEAANTGVRVVEGLRLGWVTKGQTREGQKRTEESVTFFLHVWHRRVSKQGDACTEEEELEKVRERVKETWRKAVKTRLNKDVVVAGAGAGWQGGLARLVRMPGQALPGIDELLDWHPGVSTRRWNPPGWLEAVKESFAQFKSFRYKHELLEAGRVHYWPGVGREPSPLLLEAFRGRSGGPLWDPGRTLALKRARVCEATEDNRAPVGALAAAGAHGEAARAPAGASAVAAACGEVTPSPQAAKQVRAGEEPELVLDGADEAPGNAELRRQLDEANDALRRRAAEDAGLEKQLSALRCAKCARPLRPCPLAPATRRWSAGVVA